MTLLKSGKAYVIVNVYRSKMHEHKGGHMSPLAAYDKRTDRFLFMDVSRYKYPPVWVKTQDLWNVMNTKDNHSKITWVYYRYKEVTISGVNFKTVIIF